MAKKQRRNKKGQFTKSYKPKRKTPKTGKRRSGAAYKKSASRRAAVIRAKKHLSAASQAINKI